MSISARIIGWIVIAVGLLLVALAWAETLGLPVGGGGAELGGVGAVVACCGAAIVVFAHSKSR